MERLGTRGDQSQSSKEGILGRGKGTCDGPTRRSERVQGRARPPEGRHPDRTLFCGRTGSRYGRMRAELKACHSMVAETLIRTSTGASRPEGVRQCLSPRTGWWHCLQKTHVAQEGPGPRPGGQWAGRRGHVTMEQFLDKPQVQTRSRGGSRRFSL